MYRAPASIACQTAATRIQPRKHKLSIAEFAPTPDCAVIVHVAALAHSLSCRGGPVDPAKLPGRQNQQPECDPIPGERRIAVAGDELEQTSNGDHREDERNDETDGN